MVCPAPRQRIKFQNFQPEQISEAAREAGVGGNVVLVDETAVERADQRAAVLDVKFQIIRIRVAQQPERGGNDDFVLGQILTGTREIHLKIPAVKGIVKKLDVLAQAEEIIRLHRLAQGPFVFVAVEDADVGDDLGVQ